MARKQAKGRKKTEMRKIENEDARMTTFSKRKGGVFKKASELSTLCGVCVAVILFSLGGKVYSFGFPDVGYVINKFRNVNKPENDAVMRFMNSMRQAKLEMLNQQFNDLNDKLSEEINRGKMFEHLVRGLFGQSFEEYIESLDSFRLKQLKERIMKEDLADAHHETNKELSPRCDKEGHLSKDAASETNGDLNDAPKCTQPSHVADIKSSSKYAEEVDLSKLGENEAIGFCIPKNWLKLYEEN